MNKYFRLAFVISFSLITVLATAQKLYLTAKSGYGFRIGAENHEFGNSYTVDKDGNYKEETIPVSLGQGFNGGAGIGFELKEFIAVELNFNYLQSRKFTYTYNSPSFDDKFEITGTMYQLIPSLVLKQSLGKGNAYMRMGMILGTGKVIVESQEPDFPGTLVKTLEKNGGLAMGGQFGVGYSFPLSEKFSIVGELNSNIISYGPTKGKITKAALDGQDVLGSMETYEKEFEYSSDFTSKAGAPDKTKPSTQLMELNPYHSLALMLGLRFNL